PRSVRGHEGRAYPSPIARRAMPAWQFSFGYFSFVGKRKVTPSGGKPEIKYVGGDVGSFS
ncbi:MAG: hypothetical protein ABUK01_17270, partial [Leptospirales bacterium]